MVKEAASFIKQGKLVALPTETVYGLGGDAFNPEAVAKIYSAKGRPGDNPLILHVAEPECFYKLVLNPPEYAGMLIKKFWPGPLTLIAEKKPELPQWLGGHPTGSTKTVGIRMPAFPLTRAIIKASGKIIAAPSANKAGKPSPTTAAHVLEDFPNPEEEGILIIDGGAVSVGVESTVVDVTGGKPRILRPGAVTAKMICEATGLEVVGVDALGEETPRSPGMKYRHYAPRAPMTILSGTRENISAYIKAHVMKEHAKNTMENKCFGVLIYGSEQGFFPENFFPELNSGSLKPVSVKILSLGHSKKEIAKNLFSCLRQFDKLGVDIIFAQAVEEDGIGAAIMDRMKKAADGRVFTIEAAKGMI